MLLSALLGTLGSVSLMAQSTNVYSLNAVGYINVTLEPGFNMVSCPLIASPDNTINTVLTNGTGQFKKWDMYFWNASSATYVEAEGSGTSWGTGGTNTLNPGQAAWILNPSNSAVTVTFVGTVPSGSLTNTLLPGFNLSSSILPTSGDLVTNPLMNFTTAVKKDVVYMWNPVSQSYTDVSATAAGFPAANQPFQTNVGGGFWYLNNTNTPNNWVENFSVGQ